MPIQQSTTTTEGNLTRYEMKYRRGAAEPRTYDQLAGTVRQTFEPAGSTIQIAAMTDMQPRPTTAIGSQVADFDPQTITGTTATITLEYYNDGLKAHEKTFLVSSLNLKDEIAYRVGKNRTQTVDGLARRQATEANNVLYGDGSVTARSSLSHATPGHRLHASNFTFVQAVAGRWRQSSQDAGGDTAAMAIINDFQYADLMTESASAILTRQGYAADGTKQLYNYELGSLYGVRIVKSPYAKVFYAAGAAASSAVATTLNGAIAAGAKTMVVTANTNIVAGMWLTIGTAQTAAESDTTVLTEVVYCTNVNSTTITFTGSGPLGGTIYAHATLAAVSNADSVHCAVFGDRTSLAKAYSGQLGEYGKFVNPGPTGNAEQWMTSSWKWWGGYGVLNQAGLFRVETSSSIQ